MATKHMVIDKNGMTGANRTRKLYGQSGSARRRAVPDGLETITNQKRKGGAPTPPWGPFPFAHCHEMIRGM